MKSKEIKFHKRIVLGSASRGRKSVLEGMGYVFDIVPAGIDEKAIRFDDPKELTVALAHAKADAVLKKLDSEAIVITSDQIALYKNCKREKPEDENEAREFIESYSNNKMQTVTSVVVTDSTTGERGEGVDVATLVFSEIAPKDIEKAVANKDTYSCAGALYIEGSLGQYIKSIDGEWESVHGLPIKLTQKLLAQFL